ncbi:uncharacterized protein LOC144491615 [Mustelus asterias]
MESESYSSEDAEEGSEPCSPDIQEPPPLAGTREKAGMAKGSEVLVNVEDLILGCSFPVEGSESVEADGEDPGKMLEDLQQEPVSRTLPGGDHSLEADGMGSPLPEGEQGQDSEAMTDQELRESESVSNPTTEESAEEIREIRVKYACSQAEIRQLSVELNSSSCQVGLLQLELATEKERNQQQTRRIEELEKELRSNFTLIGVLADCKTKVEQLEELKRSSQELIFKFKESKETAIHLRERITELEFQQALNEQRIKELMDQMSQCTPTTETKDEARKQQEELLNHQSLSRTGEQIGCTQNESTHHQRKMVSHPSLPATNTSKVCKIL